MKIYLSLGTNIGDKLFYLNTSILELQKSIGKLIAQSKIYETEPWGFQSSNNFLNMLVVFESSLTPLELLSEIHKIENKLKRVRTTKQYSDRTIDIDIIFYGEQIFYHESLQIPHIRAHERKFILEPLNDIAPDLNHPLFDVNIKTLLKRCQDKTKILQLTTDLLFL